MQGYIPTTTPGKLKVTVLDGHDLEGSALYVILELGTQRHRTLTAKGAGRKVVWNDSYDFRVGMSPELTVMVKSEYSVSFDNELGIADVSIMKAIQNGKHKAEVQLLNNSNEPKGCISLCMEFEAAAKPKPAIAVPIARDLSSDSLFDHSLLDSSYSFDERWELTSNASRPPLPRHNSRSLSLERSDSTGRRHRRRSSRHSDSSPHRSPSTPSSPQSVKSSRSGSNGSLKSSSSAGSVRSAFPPRDPRLSKLLSSSMSISTPRSEFGGHKPDLVPRTERAMSEIGFPLKQKKKKEHRSTSSERGFPLATAPIVQEKPPSRPSSRVLGVATPRVSAGPTAKIPFGSATPRSFMEPATPSHRSSTPRSVMATPRSMSASTPRSVASRVSPRGAAEPESPAVSSRLLAKTQSANLRSSTPRASSAKRTPSTDMLLTAPADLYPTTTKSSSGMSKVPPRPRSISSRKSMSTVIAETPKSGSTTGRPGSVKSTGVNGLPRPIWR